MTKKNKSKKRTTRSKSTKSNGSKKGIIGTVLVFLLALVLFGVRELTGIDLITPLMDESETSVNTSQETGAELPGNSGIIASNGSFTVFFTNPKAKDDGVHEGGIDVQFIEQIEAAQKSIDMALFEYDLESVTEALTAATNRGVTVRMVVDSENWEDDDEMADLLDELEKAGVKIIGDERSAFMHNKFIIFDQQKVWTGSWNVTHNGTYRNNNNAVLIESIELAENYQKEFDEMFHGESFGPRSPSDTPNPVLSINGTRVETYFSPEDEVLENMIAEINKAEKSIRFMIFSFTENDLGASIVNRAKAGVEVQGIFEKRGSETEYSEYPTMKEMGLDVLQDGNGYTLHHKVIIIDDKTVLTGSFNFSANATNSNDENILIIENADIAKQYVTEFNKLYQIAADNAD